MSYDPLYSLTMLTPHTSRRHELPLQLCVKSVPIVLQVESIIDELQNIPLNHAFSIYKR